MKITLKDARPALTKLIEDLPTSGPVEITKYGKVVAVLSHPDADPTLAYMDHIQKAHDEGRRKAQTGSLDPPTPEPLKPFRKTGSFEVSDTPPHPGIKVIPNTQVSQQAARDALLNAMKGKK